MKSQEKKAAEILGLANIEINGPNNWDIKINNNKFFNRVFSDGSLGFGESYMEGWWESNALDDTMARIISANLRQKISPNFSILLAYIQAKVSNLQTKIRSLEVGKKHYDLGNDLYSAMLDKRLVYTCAYWKNSDNLDAAQEAKLDLVCKKLHIKPGQKILDIGCGWGSFAKFAAEKYNCEVVGVTISKEQVTLANELCKNLPVEIRLQDYRDVNEKFDHIVSLGMFEHVGHKNYKTFMQVANNCLKDNGLLLLHTIGSNRSYTNGDAWLEKYIFPNSMLPSIAQVGKAAEGLFVMEDWHNFSAYYDKTLLAWFSNFDSAWPKLSQNYDQKFYRMWKYYLLSCAGAFRARYCRLWQIILSKNGLPGGYESIR